MSLFNIRPATPNDANFIISSWLKRYRDAISPRLVTDKIYYSAQHQIIAAILQKPTTEVFIACNAADEGQICGYVVGERLPDLSMIHWVYVKNSFRKWGIATELLAKFPEATQYTHRTHLVKFLDKNGKLRYNPVPLWSLT